jgi:hypothetical protein
MERHAIEGWANMVIDRVLAGQQVEDDRVEAKRTWPLDRATAARQVAALANAARGEPVMWLIGVDEKSHEVPGADNAELSDWWAQVRSQFESLAPDMDPLAVPHEGHTVVALLFDTERAPFVIKNPDFGRGPTAIELEVPFRRANSTRSARREDLLRILLPAARTPDHEVLSAKLEVTAPDSDGISQGSLEVQIYLEPHVVGPLYLPLHRVRIAFSSAMENLAWSKTESASLAPRQRYSPGPSPFHPHFENLSATIRVSDGELVVDGPGLIVAELRGRVEGMAAATPSPQPRMPINLSMVLPVSRATRPITIDVVLSPVVSKSPTVGGTTTWEMRSTRVPSSGFTEVGIGSAVDAVGCRRVGRGSSD